MKTKFFCAVTLISVFFLSSCFQESKFKLPDGTIVSVDRIKLDEFIVNDSIWLIRGYGFGASDWEALDQFTIGKIGFEPNTKDTVFIFNSQAGPYKRRLVHASIVK